MGHWFKPGSTRGTLDDQLPQPGSDGLLKPVSGGKDGHGSRGLFHLGRRNQVQAVHRLEDGYVKLTGLVDSIHKHLETQDERTRQIADALSQLAQTLGPFPEAAQAQQAQLAAMADQLESSNARFARWDATVSQIPNLADAQRETLRVFGEQVEITRLTHEQVVQSMEGFGNAVNSLGQAFSASVETLKGLQQSVTSRDDRLGTLLAEQNQKLNRLFVVALVVAAFLGVATVVMPFIR